MRYYVIYLLSLVLSIVSFSACTEKVNLDPHERAVVVHAIMEDSTVQQVKLFYTSYLSETYYPPVEEAEVYMEKMEGDEAVERYDFHKKKDGLWEADLYPQQLAYYKLTVNVPGNDVITATTRFPWRTKWVGVELYIPSVDKQSSTITDSIVNSNNIDIKSIEDSNTYYHCRLFSFMEYIPETDSYKVSSSIERTDQPTLIEGSQNSTWKEQTWLFKDYKYVGIYAIDRKPNHNFSYEDKSTVVFEGIATCSINDHDIRLGFHNTQYYQSGQLAVFIHPLSYLIVRNVNEDYEAYLKDVVSKSISLDNKDVTDLTHIWDKEETYTNLNNAVGIFAAECKYKLMVKDYIYTNIPPYWERYNLIIPGWND